MAARGFPGPYPSFVGMKMGVPRPCGFGGDPQSSQFFLQGFGVLSAQVLHGLSALVATCSMVTDPGRPLFQAQQLPVKKQGGWVAVFVALLR